jgi:hypothetical protein
VSGDRIVLLTVAEPWTGVIAYDAASRSVVAEVRLQGRSRRHGAAHEHRQLAPLHLARAEAQLLAAAPDGTCPWLLSVQDHTGSTGYLLVPATGDLKITESRQATPQQLRALAVWHQPVRMNE